MTFTTNVPWPWDSVFISILPLPFLTEGPLSAHDRLIVLVILRGFLVTAATVDVLVRRTVSCSVAVSNGIARWQVVGCGLGCARLAPSSPILSSNWEKNSLKKNFFVTNFAHSLIMACLRSVPSASIRGVSPSPSCRWTSAPYWIKTRHTDRLFLKRKEKKRYSDVILISFKYTSMYIVLIYPS